MWCLQHQVRSGGALPDEREGIAGGDLWEEKTVCVCVF